MAWTAFEPLTNFFKIGHAGKTGKRETAPEGVYGNLSQAEGLFPLPGGFLTTLLWAMLISRLACIGFEWSTLIAKKTTTYILITLGSPVMAFRCADVYR